MTRPNYAAMGRLELLAAAENAYDEGERSGLRISRAQVDAANHRAVRMECLLLAAISSNGGTLRIGDIDQALMGGPQSRRPVMYYDGSTKTTILKLVGRQT